jgi:hypothetical protein
MKTLLRSVLVALVLFGTYSSLAEFTKPAGLMGTGQIPCCVNGEKTN